MYWIIRYSQSRSERAEGFLLLALILFNLWTMIFLLDLRTLIFLF
jgi:hypothetical protein